MRALVWLLRAAAFVLLLGLAIKNDRAVELRFFLDTNLVAPLSLVILAAFAAGAAVGVTAALVTLVRQRRDISRLKRASGEESL
ncbi:MAG TPA: lipopolysaccharide assembly protein LapA domain-containing protein [Rhodocyclaceae bacterium]|nr:lipopolysaccharide assembly protein LapA domain-containing protein [Rhodocyclaceae bacterium]